MHYSTAISYCLIWEAVWAPSSPGTKATNTRGVWGRMWGGISYGEKERKGGDANKGMGGERGQAKDSKAKNQRGRLTKDGRDVAWVGACDMEMTGGRWRNAWIKARGHIVQILKWEEVDVGNWEERWPMGGGRNSQGIGKSQREARESSREWKRDASLKWHFLSVGNINVRCILPLPSQPFPISNPLSTFSTFPLLLPLHLPWPFSIRPPPSISWEQRQW